MLTFMINYIIIINIKIQIIDINFCKLLIISLLLTDSIIIYFFLLLLGIGDWAQSPIPNPQSPIPNK